MKWSLKLFKIGGIDIAVHALFPLLLLWVGGTTYLETKNIKEAADGVGFIIVLFTIVVIHELSHALTAKSFGIRTRSITLLPIGGVANMERMPEKPWQEFLVAIAGPTSNFVMAIICLALLLLTQPGFWNTEDIEKASWLERLFFINIGLGVFNLLPAFPMDGGRVLRALLSMKLGLTRATNIAANIGKGFAVLMAIFGYVYNPMMIFIAVFVWFGATQEAGYTRVKMTIHQFPVHDAMMTDFRTLPPEAALNQASHIMLDGHQTEIPIVEDGQLVGLVSRHGLIRALSEGNAKTVGEIREAITAFTGPFEPLDNVFERLQSMPSGCLPVIHNGQFVGLITAAHVGEFLMFQQALQRLHSESR
jgi:Zn-dependent protease/CBS domain-containing protein